MFQTFISHNPHNDHFRWVLLSLFYRQRTQGLGKLNNFLKFTKTKNLNHCPLDSRAYISPSVIAASRTSPLCSGVTLTGKPYSLLLDLHFANAFVQV